MLNIQPGESGPRVALLQILLNRAGASVNVDGQFGQSMISAVTSFKKRVGLAGTTAVRPELWWKLPLGSNTLVVDVVDVGDPKVGGGAVQNLVQAGGDPIQLGLMCAGVEQMVSDVIRKSNGPGTIALLRITGHGNLGRWMTVSVGDVVDATKTEQKILASEDHSYVASANFTKLSHVLARLKPYFAPYGMMEHGGCSLGGRGDTRHLMQRMAILWDVPVSVGVGIQTSILNFDGATFTAYPKHGTLSSWSKPFRLASY